MSREILQSDHKFHSLGLFPHKSIEFTTLPDSIEKFTGDVGFEGILSLHFYYSLDFIEHQRQIYNPLDFLGDVGGLADALLAIGSIFIWILQFLFGNSMKKYMIKTIFEKDNSHKIVSNSHKAKLKLLLMRKRARINKIWCSKRSKLTRLSAENKIE